MTDKTDIAAIKINTYSVNGNDAWPQCADDDRRGSYVKWDDVVKLLEAERQRADDEKELNKHLDLAIRQSEGVNANLRRLAEKAEAEIAAMEKHTRGVEEALIAATDELASLKADQVPVGFIEFVKCNNPSTQKIPAWDLFENGRYVDPVTQWWFELFTAPQKPVVLPKSFSQSDYLSHGIEPSDAYGLSYGSSEMRALCKKAIEVAGGIVKDGE